ncbi:MAG: ATP-binding cassette domain-containing protein [Myxococcota bacterium]|nr:ATP-binding cassette domain-containing protein [Myxococcota bacterium]
MSRENLLLPGLERWPRGTPIISLERVSKRFGSLEVIRDLSLEVTAGQTLVIAGQSGSGKSVLLRLMNGLERPDEGRVFLFGEDLSQVSGQRKSWLRKRCSMVFQNYALIDSMTVMENLTFPLREHLKMPRVEMRRLGMALLELLELPHVADSSPSSLSGGMKKRVAFARALITQPELVLFDEPTTGLDPIMIEFVDALIRKTQKEFDLSAVIISHDMASNYRLADEMAILAEGQIVSRGSFGEVRLSPHPVAQALMKSAVTERFQGGESGTPEVEEIEAGSATVADDQRRFEEAMRAAERPEIRAGEIAAEVIGLHKSFGEREILKGISLQIPARKITVIIGGSGSGKSVLVKHLIGLLEPSAGEIFVLGHHLRPGAIQLRRQLQSQIGVLFQGAALFDSMTIRENIAFPLIEGHRQRPQEARERVEEIARELRVDRFLERSPAEISNGERKRVALARALITRPKMMIYDEPTTGQDPIMMARVDEMIVEASERFQITSIVISHDMLSTFRIADQISMIYHGELVASGSPEMLRASQDQRVRDFVFAGAGA